MGPVVYVYRLSWAQEIKERALMLVHGLCFNKTVRILDFCRCLNVKLSPIGWGFSLLKFQPIGDSFTFRHLQKSRLHTVLLEQRPCPSSSDSSTSLYFVWLLGTISLCTVCTTASVCRSFSIQKSCNWLVAESSANGKLTKYGQVRAARRGKG